MPETTTDPRLSQTLRMIEIYCSVQGESTWVGLPCVFIRLARCNLRCRWCDTTYSFHGGEKQSLDAVLRETLALGVSLVEITGGEPLAQKACIPLAELLIEAGCTVLIETSGSLPINTLPDPVIRIMDLKCPDSDMCAHNDWANIDHLRADRDEVKFVLASRRDYEWSRDTVRRYNLTQCCRAVLFSPVFGEVDPKDIVAWMLEDGLSEVRFQLQMHKFIWPPEERGV